MLTTLWINRQFRKAGFPVFATRQLVVVNFYSHSLVIRPDMDGYIRAWKLPLDGFTYLFLTDKQYFYLKLNQYKLLRLQFEIPNQVKYYYRSKRRSYVNGVLMSWSLVKVMPSNPRKYYLLQREDGKQIYYSHSTFKKLFTLRPKYTLTEQLKLF